MVALDPDSVAAGMAPRDLNLLGYGFTQQTRIKLNGVARQFQLVAANEITVMLNSADVNSPSVIAVNVSEGAQSTPAGNSVSAASSRAGLATNQTFPPTNKRRPSTKRRRRPT